jgi:hypothetical protein
MNWLLQEYLTNGFQAPGEEATEVHSPLRADEGINFL